MCKGVVQTSCFTSLCVCSLQCCLLWFVSHHRTTCFWHRSVHGLRICGLCICTSLVMNTSYVCFKSLACQFVQAKGQATAHATAAVSVAVLDAFDMCATAGHTQVLLQLRNESLQVSMGLSDTLVAGLPRVLWLLNHWHLLACLQRDHLSCPQLVLPP